MLYTSGSQLMLHGRLRVIEENLWSYANSPGAVQGFEVRWDTEFRDISVHECVFRGNLQIVYDFTLAQKCRSFEQENVHPQPIVTSPPSGMASDMSPLLPIAKGIHL